jgi:hypothetical protein
VIYIELIWVLFLFVLHFVGPVLTVIALIWGCFKLRNIYREIKSVRASRGDATAMELELTRYKARLALIGAVILALVGVYVGIHVTMNAYVTLAIAALCFFPLFGWSRALKRRYNEGFKSNFVAAELSKIFGDLRYKPDECFSRDEILGLGFFSHTDGIGGSDFIEADYKGLRFSQSDLVVEEIWTETVTDSDGNTGEVTRSREVFGGRVMKFDFADSFRGDVQVLSGDFDGARVLDSGAGWQKVETELAEFGERFKIFARDPLDAMAALTPQMIEGIYYLERAVNKPLSFYFRGNSMYAFLSLGHDAFEVGKKTLLEAREQLTGDIKLTTDFLETMYFRRQESGDALPAAEPLRQRRDIPTPSFAGDLRRKAEKAVSFVVSGVGRTVFGLYLASAVYTFARLPDGIVMSSNMASENAVTAPTLVYLTVMTIFVAGFMLPFLTRQKVSLANNFEGTSILWRLVRFVATRSVNIFGTAFLLLFHWLCVSANIGG